jgi:hypothetical protein
VKLHREDAGRTCRLRLSALFRFRLRHLC